MYYIYICVDAVDAVDVVDVADAVEAEGKTSAKLRIRWQLYITSEQIL